MHYGENKIEIDSVDLRCVKANRRHWDRTAGSLWKVSWYCAPFNAIKKYTDFITTQSIEHALNSLCESA